MIVYLLPVLPVQLKSTCEPSLLTSKTFPESASTETISPELTSIEIEQAADFAGMVFMRIITKELHINNKKSV